MKLRDKLATSLLLMSWALLLMAEVQIDTWRGKLKLVAFKFKYWIFMIAYWIVMRIPPL